MGLFDTINVWQKCPYCGKPQLFDAQTKDLECAMHTYTVYDDDEFIDRSKLPVFKAFPLEKGYSAWESQEEMKLAAATVDIKADHVNVIADCNSIICQFHSDRKDILGQGCPSGFGRSFRGKIKVKDGLLVGKIYDLELDDNESEEELDKYKDVNPKKFKRLMKKYKHEPIVCRAWGFKND
jgi:hypothetical protein